MNNEVMKEYIKKISVLVLLVVMVSATAAAVVFPIFKFVGLYPDVSYISIAVFVAVIAVEDIVGVVLVKRSLAQEVVSD